MDKPREYLFSESLENFTYDDYIKAGDDGPFYTVVSACAYTTLHAEALKLREALKESVGMVISEYCSHRGGCSADLPECYAQNSYKAISNFDKYIKEQE